MKNVPDILLVKLPPWDPRTAPLGVAYLATFLKSKNIDIKVLDLNIEMYNSLNDEGKKGWGNEDFHWWISNRFEKRYELLFEQFVGRILSFGTRAIGFSATLPSIPFLNILLGYLKKKAVGRIVIVGGPATFFEEIRTKEFEGNLIDYFIVGDGEAALYELLNNLGDDGGISLGLHLRCRVWKNKPFEKAVCIQAHSIMDMDSIPCPTFEEFDLALYTEGSRCPHFTLPIIFSKGCTRSCTFCSDVVLSRPYRCRDPKKVIKEIIMHVKRYDKLNTFRLNDLSLNANLKFLDEFCEIVILEGLKIKWYGQAQVRPDMDVDLLHKMKKAGCRQLDLGVESFSDHVLSLMRKRYAAKEAIDFLRAAKEAGIETNILLIVGYPGETEEDFKDSLDIVRGNSKYIDRIGSLNICGMPVGSELRRSPHKYNYFFPPDSDWVTIDHTNTYEVRRRRFIEVIRCCNELNLRVESCLDLEIFEEGNNKSKA